MARYKIDNVPKWLTFSTAKTPAINVYNLNRFIGYIEPYGEEWCVNSNNCHHRSPIVVPTMEEAAIVIDKLMKAKKPKPPKSKTKKKRGKKKKWAKKVSSSKGFYSTWEWKKLRFRVLKKYGAKCMLCGSTEHIVVDHIKPRSKYPELALDFNNLQVLCNSCNMGKSNTDETDFRPK